MIEKNLLIQKKEIATAYIIQKDIFRVVPLYDYSELSIVDEVINQKKNKNKQNSNQFFFQKKGAK
ncbi:MAG: hypothetical protein ACTSRX_09990 [Promethearchaeota archaeon]